MSFTRFSLCAAALTLLTLLGTTAVAAPERAATPDAEPLPVAVKPGNPLIRYVGRFQTDATGTVGPRCSWPASHVSLRFSGNKLNVRLNESSNSDAYEIVIDGASAGVLFPRGGSHRYQIYPKDGAAAAKSGSHTITLVKRTEAFFGITQFEGFELSRGGRLQPLPPPPTRRIEVIGDSISCGYGNEAANEKEHFSARTENAYMTYGAIAARAVNADYTCIAWSGRLMWPTNTMDEVYDRTLPTDAASRWDFRRGTPDVVVINLGTNDMYAKTVPAEDGWVGGYRTFIARVRKNYPKALIYCATSPMLWGEKDTRERRYLHRIVDEENRSGDAKVRFLDFKTQNAADGIGADWHPSIRTHQRMAAVLTEVLAKNLRWETSHTNTRR